MLALLAHQAEEALLGARDGSFVVRNSLSDEELLVLTVMHLGRTCQYIIRNSPVCA
jgi:hypothetical protein